MNAIQFTKRWLKTSVRAVFLLISVIIYSEFSEATAVQFPLRGWVYSTTELINPCSRQLTGSGPTTFQDRSGPPQELIDFLRRQPQHVLEYLARTIRGNFPSAIAAVLEGPVKDLPWWLQERYTSFNSVVDNTVDSTRAGMVHSDNRGEIPIDSREFAAFFRALAANPETAKILAVLTNTIDSNLLATFKMTPDRADAIRQSNEFNPRQLWSRDEARLEIAAFEAKHLPTLNLIKGNMAIIAEWYRSTAFGSHLAISTEYGREFRWVAYEYGGPNFFELVFNNWRKNRIPFDHSYLIVEIAKRPRGPNWQGQLQSLIESSPRLPEFVCHALLHTTLERVPFYGNQAADWIDIMTLAIHRAPEPALLLMKANITGKLAWIRSNIEEHRYSGRAFPERVEGKALLERLITILEKELSSRP